MCDFGEKTNDLHRMAEPLDGQFVTTLASLSARLNMTLVAGMFEKVPGDHLVRNAAVVVYPVKGLVGAFHKRHLFDAFGEVESDRFRAEPGLGFDRPQVALGFFVELHLAAG